MILRFSIRLVVVFMALLLPQGNEALRRVEHSKGLRGNDEAASSTELATAPQHGQHRALEADDLLCRIFVVQTRLDGFPDIVDEESYECFPWTGEGESSQSYQIDLPSDFITNHQSDLGNGECYVIIPNGTISDGQVIIPVNGTLGIHSRRTLREMGVQLPPDEEKRKLGLNLEYRTVLIIRVKAPDSAVTLTKSDLSRYFFNNSMVSLRSQYYACSHGKLVIAPIGDRKSIGLVGGVVDVSIPTPALGTNRSIVKNAATLAASTLLGVSSLSELNSFVVYCLPPGTSGNWLSYAFINYIESVFNNEWCTFVSAQMHELGHNTGQTHSHENFKPYADRSCTMGFSYPMVSWPTMCFNAHKLWKFGWFSDAAITIDPDVGALVKLIPVADYDRRASDQYVLVRIQNPGGTGPQSPDGLSEGLDFYLQWNVAKGENLKVISKVNLTTIVQEYSGFSNLVAALDVNKNYTIPYTYSNGDTVVIKVCAFVNAPGTVPDYLALSVSRDGDNCDGIYFTDCSDDNYKFPFQGSIVSCMWLSKRPNYYDSACKNAGVASHCRKTCNENC